MRLVEALKEGHTSSVKQLEIEANKRMRDAKANRVQALGEVVFGTSTADIGLPSVRVESPLIEFCRWSLEASKGRTTPS